MADKQVAQEKIEREYTIPLREEWRKVPRYKRTNKAVKAMKEFLARHMKIYDRDLNKIKIDQYLNEFMWFRGIRKPPVKIKVKAIREGEIVRVELAELPTKLKFKKIRKEKTESQAKKAKDKKKTLIEKAKEEVQKPSEEITEEKKEEAEKKAAVVESGKELEKEAAKKAKHQTKIKAKEPKRQQRFALQK